MDTGNISDLLSSLSADDIASLQSMASSLFGGGSSEEKNEEAKQQSDPPMGIDPKTMASVASLLSKMQSRGDDDNTRLIAALRPLLSEKRRRRADDAIKILQLFEILPLLKDSGVF